MLPRYADIIIDISHEAIDRPFQYRIPDELQEKIQIGSMVKIPFGRGNHLRTGYVIGFSDQTEYQPDRIKKIAELCDRSVPVEGRLLALAAWIRENYGSTMINAIRMVMPVKKTIRQLTDQMVVLTDQMDAEQLARVREQTCTGEVAAATGAGRSAGTVSVNGYCQTETEYLFGYTESDAAGKSHRSHQQRTISDGGDL